MKRSPVVEKYFQNPGSVHLFSPTQKTHTTNFFQAGKKTASLTYPSLVKVIYAAFGPCNSFSHYRASLAYTERRSWKMDDLTVLVAFWPGTLAMLSSKVNSPVTHESTR